MRSALKHSPLRREASKSHLYDFLFLITAFFIFFLLRLPSLFEPYWYGDEGIYQVIGDILNRGGLLYRDIWDNKPPLLYLLYALFNSDQFTLRFISFIFGGISIVVFFLLSKKLLPYYFLTTSIFILLLGFPVIEGNIANAENFMMLPILLSALLVFTSSKSLNDTKDFKSKFKFSIFSRGAGSRFARHFPFSIFISGVLLGIAFLFKVVAIFDLLAFVSFLFIINIPHGVGLSVLKYRNYLLLFFKRTLPIIFGFLIPILVTTSYFWVKGAFVDFVRATFLSNISYVAWQNTLIFPQGLLLLKTALLTIVVILIAKKRKELNLNVIFILLWFVFSLYNVFFTQRPYTHYLLVLLPSFSLMFGLILWERRYKKIMLLFFILAFVLIIKNFNIYSKTIGYYQNFVLFIKEGRSVTSYREFFDKRTPIDYDIAIFLKGKVRNNDSIFIWGNNVQLYKMAGVVPPGKYIASYHILGNKDGIDTTEDAIEKKKPRYIIIMPDQSPFPFSLMRYSQRINIDKVSIYERFF